jgi:hypothetical protein
MHRSINRREVRHSAAIIVNYVKKTLTRYDNVYTEAILRLIWSSQKTALHLSLANRVSLEDVAEVDIFSGLVQSLSEVKRSRSKAQLVVKHVLLIAIVSSGVQMTMRQTAPMLAVHYRKVLMAVQRQALMASK